MKRVNFLKLFLLSAATLVSSAYAIAQEDDEDGYGIEEVIVTVERRQTSSARLCWNSGKH